MSLHLSQLDEPGKVMLKEYLHTQKQRNPKTAVPIEPQKEREPAQAEVARALRREALKLASHKQTLNRQISLAESVIRTADSLREKSELLLESVSRNIAPFEQVSLDEEEVVAIEERALNALERRVSEYEALVMKLGERCSLLFSQYNEVNGLIRQLRKSNCDLVEKHLSADMMSSGPHSDNRGPDVQRPRTDAKRGAKRLKP